MTDSGRGRVAERKTDLVLDITLWVEIAVLALTLLEWHPTVRPFPDVFPRSPPHARPR